METLTFRCSVAQFLRTVIMFAVILGVIAVIGIRIISSHHALLLTFDALLFVLSALFTAGDRTSVDSEGIRIRRAFVVTSLYAWSEIASVHEHQQTNMARLKMRLSNGDEYNLPYPINTNLIQDPDYSARRDRIIEYWQQRTAEPDAN